MKKRPAVVVVLVATAIVLLFLLKPSRKPAAPAEAPPAALAGIPEAAATAAARSNASGMLLHDPGMAPVIPPGPATPAMTLPPAAAVSAPAPLVDGLPPATVLDNLRSAVRQYGQRFHGNPVGTNPEITKALNGGNPKQVQFIAPGTGLRTNDRGELIDPWGTPFFFHQLSAAEMEVRSAGPDKVMWTDDDLVTQ